MSSAFVAVIDSVIAYSMLLAVAYLTAKNVRTTVCVDMINSVMACPLFLIVAIPLGT